MGRKRLRTLHQSNLNLNPNSIKAPSLHQSLWLISAFVHTSPH